MSSEHYIEHANLSHAWAEAMRLVLARGEAPSLVVAVTGFDANEPHEDLTLRRALDKVLDSLKMQSCDTVANTIFPSSLWNPAMSANALFERYRTILPKLRKAHRANHHGLYFERLISGGPVANPNQLEFIIDNYKKRAGVRRSSLQLAVFDAARDHSTAAQLGFPCLQHVTFAPTDDGLCVNGFYATQYVLQRAYGNYLGLCRLGRFVAHELGMPLIRMTCFTGIMLKESKAPKRSLSKLIAAIDAAVPQE